MAATGRIYGIAHWREASSMTTTPFHPAIVWHGIQSPIHRSTTWHYAILTSGTNGTKRDSKGRSSQCCTSTLCLKKRNVFRKKWRTCGNGRASQLMVLNRLMEICNGVPSYLHQTVAYHSTIVQMKPNQSRSPCNVTLHICPVQRAFHTLPLSVPMLPYNHHHDDDKLCSNTSPTSTYSAVAQCSAA